MLDAEEKNLFCNLLDNRNNFKSIVIYQRVKAYIISECKPYNIRLKETCWSNGTQLPVT